MGPTEICNMSLGWFGAKRINSYEDSSDTKPEAIQCRLHYEQTRDALIRSHWWRFARARATLSANAAYTADDNTFEWTYAYDLPADFLRMKKPYEGETTNILIYTYSLEDKQLLSNETTMEIQYIKKVTDPTEFDPLFVEVLVLQLALKMVIPLAGAGSDGRLLRREIKDELWGTPQQPGLMARVRVLDKQETNTIGRNDQETWNDARVVGAGNPLKRYS